MKFRPPAVDYQHHRLQSVLNAAARLIHRTSRCQHVTSSARASLATVQTACWLQTRRPHFPVPPWTGTTLPSGVATGVRGVRAAPGGTC